MSEAVPEIHYQVAGTLSNQQSNGHLALRQLFFFPLLCRQTISRCWGWGYRDGEGWKEELAKRHIDRLTLLMDMSVDVIVDFPRLVKILTSREGQVMNVCR